MRGGGLPMRRFLESRSARLARTALISRKEKIGAISARLRRGEGERKVRHLPVLHGEHLVGLVSERDLFLLDTVRSVDPEKEPVEEAMTEDPFAVAPDANVREVLEEMLAKRYGSAMVVERGRVVGIF